METGRTLAARTASRDQPPPHDPDKCELRITIASYDSLFVEQTFRPRPRRRPRIVPLEDDDEDEDDSFWLRQTAALGQYE